MFGSLVLAVPRMWHAVGMQELMKTERNVYLLLPC